MVDGSTESLAADYRRTLLEDIIPFWLRHAFDPFHLPRGLMAAAAALDRVATRSGDRS